MDAVADEFLRTRRGVRTVVPIAIMKFSCCLAQAVRIGSRCRAGCSCSCSRRPPCTKRAVVHEHGARRHHPMVTTSGTFCGRSSPSDGCQDGSRVAPFSIVNSSMAHSVLTETVEAAVATDRRCRRSGSPGRTPLVRGKLDGQRAVSKKVRPEHAQRSPKSTDRENQAGRRRDFATRQYTRCVS